MATPFEFYFDFSSPYGYLGSTRIEALAGEFNRGVLWRPILLGAIFKKTGSMPLADIPLKGDYSKRDFVRSAGLFGIPYHQPERFPISTVTTARAMLWIEREKGAPVAVQFAKDAYNAYFVQQQDINNADIVATLAEKLGIDGGLLKEGVQQPDIKNALRERTESAIQAGVFGSPFIIVDGEPFWGFDRYDHIRKWLQKEKRA